MNTIIKDFDNKEGKDLVIADLEQEVKSRQTLIERVTSELEHLQKDFSSYGTEQNNDNAFEQRQQIQYLITQRETSWRQLLQMQKVLDQLYNEVNVSVKESFGRYRDGWEAIICAKYRPALAVREEYSKYTLREDDLERLGVVRGNDQNWREIITGEKQQAMLSNAHKVGRIGLFNSNYWQGTGALLFRENLVVTNRHVLTNNGFYELNFQDYNGRFFTGKFNLVKMGSTPAIDFNAVYNAKEKKQQRLSLGSPFVSSHLDYGLLTLKKSHGYLEVDTNKYSDDDLKDRKVYVLGHPAIDERAYVSDLRIFEHYDYKHIMPGTIRSVEQVAVNKNIEPRIYHDCSTLGGCSGAPLIDIESGKVIAIHWGGVHREQNYALPIWTLIEDLNEKGKKDLYNALL
ncbi:serine protease [Candidatus Uabimicrobium sp. HlEnr_7]|uniref:trypsin-like serine peptidase n=1 Tax=Candidatus Uabimicrobium helgolandensis TaxID=3095367 RepID=UPI0035564B90